MNVISLTYLGLVGLISILLWITPRKGRWLFVVLGNLAFLYLIHPSKKVMALLATLVVYTWLSGLLVKKFPKRFLAFVLSIGCAFPLLFFKYAGYFTEHVWIMPLGLSFFTFKAISYIVDVERGKCDARNPALIFAYLYFFPTYQAGPINRSASFFEETDRPFVFDYLDQKNGTILAGLGLFQKFVIADFLSRMVGQFLNPELSGWYTVFGMFLYAMQLYVDFDAYSNIAIGSARMMGYHLDRNFHTPYLADSLRDFWRRWHMSLSSWLRDYIYIPLGGSRKGLLLKWVNTIVLFLVSGLWHGSTMMFVLWGLGHGLLSVLEDILRTVFRTSKLKKGPKAILHILGIPVNFVLVTLLWVLFRSSSMTEVSRILLSMKGALSIPCMLSYETAGLTINEWHWMLVLLVVVILTDILRNRINMITWLSKRNIVIRWALYFILMVVAIIFGVYGPGYDPQNFIYVTF